MCMPLSLVAGSGHSTSRSRRFGPDDIGLLSISSLSTPWSEAPTSMPSSSAPVSSASPWPPQHAWDYGGPLKDHMLSIEPSLAGEHVGPAFFAAHGVDPAILGWTFLLLRTWTRQQRRLAKENSTSPAASSVSTSLSSVRHQRCRPTMGLVKMQ